MGTLFVKQTLLDSRRYLGVILNIPFSSIIVSQAHTITRYAPEPEFCFILSSVTPDHFVLTAHGSIILTAIPNGST